MHTLPCQGLHKPHFLLPLNPQELCQGRHHWGWGNCRQEGPAPHGSWCPQHRPACSFTQQGPFPAKAHCLSQPSSPTWLGSCPPKAAEASVQFSHRWGSSPRSRCAARSVPSQRLQSQSPAATLMTPTSSLGPPALAVAAAS